MKNRKIAAEGEIGDWRGGKKNGWLRQNLRYQIPTKLNGSSN
jgi:hypothetical protein